MSIDLRRSQGSILFDSTATSLDTDKVPKHSTSWHTVAAVSANVGAFIIFITCFFFTIGAAIEKSTLEYQLGFIVQESVQTPLWFTLSSAQMTNVTDQIEATPIPDLSAEDAAAKASDSKIMRKGFSVMLPVGALFLISGLALEALRTSSMKRAGVLLGWTALILLGIAAVEIMMAMLVSRFYLTVNSHFIGKHITLEILKARGLTIPPLP